MRGTKLLASMFTVAVVMTVGCGSGNNNLPVLPVTNTGGCQPYGAYGYSGGYNTGYNAQPCNPYTSAFPGNVPGYPGYGPGYQFNYGGQYTFSGLPYVWYNNSYVSSQAYWYMMYQYYMQSSYYTNYGSQYWYFYQWYRSTPYYANTYLWAPGYGGGTYPISSYLNGYNSYNGYGPGLNIGLNFSFMNNH